MSRNVECTSIFLIGPPVDTQPVVAHLVELMLREYAQTAWRQLHNFTVTAISGPVDYDASWRLEQPDDEQNARAGMQSLAMWRVTACWQNYTLPAGGVTLIVQDFAFYGPARAARPWMDPSYVRLS